MRNLNQAPNPIQPADVAPDAGRLALGGSGFEHVVLTTVLQDTGNPDVRVGDTSGVLVDRSNPREPSIVGSTKNGVIQ